MEKDVFNVESCPQLKVPSISGYMKWSHAFILAIGMEVRWRPYYIDTI